MYSPSMVMIDLLSMMVFSMLAAIAAINLLSAFRRVQLPLCFGVWMRRLSLAGLSLGASALVPTFAPALLAAGAVAVIAIGRVSRLPSRGSVGLYLLGRST